MSFQKFDYVRSRQLLKAVASLPCQHCGRDGYTQAAHSNQAVHGKGRGIKSSDIFTAALCVTCHYLIDQGNTLSKEERLEIWNDAWVKTVRALVLGGDWPLSVPVPSVRICH